MSLKITAQHLANQGRGNDSSLVHMSPREISALNDLARTKGQNLTINPQTGLPEAGLLEDLLPAVVGGALNYFAPGVGTAVGGLFGLGGAAGTGIAVGALSTLASGNLGKGLMAGLGAYGGAGVTEGIAGLGMGNIGREAVESATSQGLQGEALQQSVAQRMANVPMSEKFGAGMDYFRDKPMDAAKVLGKSALTAAAPIFAGQGISESVPTTTPRPSPQGYIRRSSYDPYRQEFRGEEPYEAANGGLMSVASGGAAYADGGTVGYADGGLTPEQIKSAIDISRQQGFSEADVATGLGRYITDPSAVAAALAANPFGQTGAAPAAVVPQAAPSATTQTYTPEQIKSAIDISRQQGFSEADVATGLGRYLPNQTAVTSALAANPYGAANIVNPDIYTPFGGSSAYSNPLAGGFGAAAPQATTLPASTSSAAAQTYTPEQIKSAIETSRQQGFSEADVATGLGRFLSSPTAVAAALAANPKPVAYNPATQSTAEYWATQPGWSSATGNLTGVPGLNQNIANYAGNITPATVKTLGLSNAAAVEARIRADMKATGASDADVLRATGKTVAEIAAGAFPKTTPVTPVTPVGPVTPSVPTSITTTDKDTLADGVSGSTGAGIVGGGTVVNPNGTITVSPRIPGIPVGGFTGMEQVRNAYTAGGGKLGITPSFVPKTVAEMNARYANTGDSKAMYDYLTGKGPYPIKTGTQDPAGAIREVARPYSEAVLGMPAKANKPYIWNPTKGEYSKNPDYVRQEKIKNAEGKLVTRNFMSLNQAKSEIAQNNLSGNSLVAWAKRNNVDQDTLADALGVSVFDVQKMFLDADEVGAAKNGGLMSLAKGGLAYAAGGGIEDVTDPATGDKYIYDYREGGRYRKAVVVKDGVTYKWNPVTKKYEASSGNAGVDTLMNNQTGGGGGQTNFESPSQFDTPSGIGIGGRTPLAADYLSGKISGFFAGPRTDAPAPVEDRTPTAAPTPANTAAADYAGQVAAQTQAADADAMANAMSGADSYSGNVGSGSGYMANGGVINYAQGGLGSLGGYSDGGRLLRGPGDGTSDHIPATIGGKQPARLADGEFVVSADVVSGLGNGSTEAGARKLYAMMDRVRKARTGTKKMGRTIHPEKHLPA